MVKISDLISAGAELLQTIAENPRGETRILLAHTLGVSISHLLVHSEEMVPEDKAELFKDYIFMRTRHMPIAYMTFQTFLKLVILSGNRCFLLLSTPFELNILVITGEIRIIALTKDNMDKFNKSGNKKCK